MLKRKTTQYNHGWISFGRKVVNEKDSLSGFSFASLRPHYTFLHLNAQPDEGWNDAQPLALLTPQVERKLSESIASNILRNDPYFPSARESFQSHAKKSAFQRFAAQTERKARAEVETSTACRESEFQFKEAAADPGLETVALSALQSASLDQTTSSSLIPDHPWNSS